MRLRETNEGRGCRHCGQPYWDRLPACPYCGTVNRTSGNDSFGAERLSLVDPRKFMKLCSNNFYYIFLGISLLLAFIIAFHDIVENMLNNVNPDFIELQRKTYKLAWILIPVQTIIFCYWLMVHYNALARLHIHKRLGGWLAWSNFVPVVNLYFPQAMVQELMDRLYYVRVSRINIRFVPVWWFFQAIANFYLTLVYITPSFMDRITGDYFWFVIVLEIIWAIAISCQGFLLFDFNKAINSVSSNRYHASAGNSRARIHRR